VGVFDKRGEKGIMPKPGSNEIRFKANPNYKDEDVVKFVEQIVCGTGSIFEKQGGYRWQLGPSNDWWMDKDQQMGEFILACRYGSGGNAIYMQLLYHLIIWRLGAERFNEEARAKMTRPDRLLLLRLYFSSLLAEKPATGTAFDNGVMRALKELGEEYAE